MRPRCWNRPPFAAGRWHLTGERRNGKPVARWHPRWFVDQCATWFGRGIGPTEDTTHYPQAHGWAESCQSCRWIPLEHKA